VEYNAYSQYVSPWKRWGDVPFHYDVLIIGGGVVGCAIARELSRFQVKTAVVEKELDVGFGTSCRNSGVLHAGFNYTPGTLRAYLCVKGNALMDELCRDLKVKIRRIGKLTVALDKDDEATLHRLKAQGDANGVPGLELIGGARMRTIQPGVEGALALYSPSSSILSPYALTIGLAENALDNGAHFHLGQEVVSIAQSAGSGWRVGTASGDSFTAEVIVNAAGLYAAEVCGMAGIMDYHIYPCRGEYYVLDKRLNGTLNALIYPAPKKNSPGLGIHLTPTVDGNILIGPSAQYLDDPADYGCSACVMEDLRREGQNLLPDIRVTDYIRSFSGNRAKRTPPSVGGNADFVIEDRRDKEGFINLLGIESPGLTSSPAIALMVREMVEKHVVLRPNPSFNPLRQGSALFFSELPSEEKADLIAKNPNYGEIVCRCEKITKQEILDAIHNPLGARTLASIKYRARASMGRCQGGFCIPRIARILRDEFGFRPEDFLKSGASSPLFVGNVRPAEAGAHR